MPALCIGENASSRVTSKYSVTRFVCMYVPLLRVGYVEHVPRDCVRPSLLLAVPEPDPGHVPDHGQHRLAVVRVPGRGEERKDAKYII